MDETFLRITEIFYSLQGETKTCGYPTTFIRLTGCPLRCQYCDTAYAFTGGDKRSISDILSTVNKTSCEYVTVTGGEPLAQPNCIPLLKSLVKEGYKVSIETSGALDIKDIPDGVRTVMDIKTPGSGEVDKNLLENLNHLDKTDEIKFVICDRDDYIWSKDLVREYQLKDKCDVLFSASNPELKPEVLADWILEDKLQIRFQVQLHKVLWGDVPGR